MLLSAFDLAEYDTTGTKYDSKNSERAAFSAKNKTSSSASSTLSSSATTTTTTRAKTEATFLSDAHRILTLLPFIPETVVETIRTLFASSIPYDVQWRNVVLFAWSRYIIWDAGLIETLLQTSTEEQTSWTEEQWAAIRTSCSRRLFPLRLLQEINVDRRDKEAVAASDEQRVACIMKDLSRYLEMIPQDVWEQRCIAKERENFLASTTLSRGERADTFLFLTSRIHYDDDFVSMAALDEMAFGE
jgi:hypothetical protein